MTLFAGLWFNTGNPSEKQLEWIGRLVMNYQHCESIFHTGIIVFGLLYVLCMGCASGKSKGSCVPFFIRWTFFFFMFVETVLMCIPYLFLFYWAWGAFKYSPRNPIVSTIENVGDDKFLDGVYIGGMMISFLFTSVVCLVLDGAALWKSWFHARNTPVQLDFITIVVFVGPCLAFAYFYYDFTAGESTVATGGVEGRGKMAQQLVDSLYNLFDGRQVQVIKNLVHGEL